MRRRRVMLANAVLWPCLLAACGGDESAPRLAATLEVVSAPPASTTAGRTLPDTFAVRALDDAGRPVAGALVSWRVAAGGGEVLPLETTTRDDGTARARWRLGGLPGAQSLVATLANQAGATLTTTAAALVADEADAARTFACARLGTQLWCFSEWDLDALLGPAVGQEPRGALRIMPNVTARQLSVAGGRVCALDDAGRAWCRGVGIPYAAGLDGTEITGLPALRRIDIGDYTSCGIAVADSTAWCWRTPSGGGVFVAQLSPSLRFLDVSAFWNGACGLGADSAAYCWESTSTGSPDAAPGGASLVPGGRTFRQVVSAQGVACGAATNGRLYCWGALAGAATPVDQGFGTSVYSAGSVVYGGNGAAIRPLLGFSSLDLSAELLDAANATDFRGDGGACALGAGGTVFCSEGILLGGLFVEAPPGILAAAPPLSPDAALR